jgi:hypothetical protein
MTSLAEPVSSLLGAQTPRILSVPPRVSSLGQEIVELAAAAGMHLDPWEAFVLEEALGVREDGRWSAFEVGLMVSRQNGKGSILEAVELGGLFVLGDKLQIHSAHQFDTSLEAYRRLKGLIQETPELDKRVRRYVNSHGEEGIELRDGRRIRFRTRTKGGGRGFSGDRLILDEAMILPITFHGALLPTLSAQSIRGNPQVWYTGSAVDQTIHEDGVVFARIRERGHAGGDKSLAYFEWSIDGRDEGDESPFTPDRVTEELARDPHSWAAANPGLGIRISEEHVALEMASFGGATSRAFAVERLGVGDWPATDGGATKVIDPVKWASLVDRKSDIEGDVWFAFDVTPARTSSAIAVAGRRADDLAHLEITGKDGMADHRRGTGWVVARILELTKAHKSAGVICDGASPAASLIPELEQAGVTVTTVTASEHAAACGLLFDAVDNDELRHLGTHELSAAVAGAVKRPLGEAWAWSRKNSTVDISPLVAVTLAHWAVMSAPRKGDLLPPMFA